MVVHLLILKGSMCWQIWLAIVIENFVQKTRHEFWRLSIEYRFGHFVIVEKCKQDFKVITFLDLQAPKCMVTVAISLALPLLVTNEKSRLNRADH